MIHDSKLIDTGKKLKRSFYLRNELDIAKELLGKIFVKRTKNSILAGIIVETEAYNGLNDRAAHSFNGRTSRTEVMFWEGGYLYVYFTYGMYYCFNVVCGKKNEGNAVLIRAIEPLVGIEEMYSNRFPKEIFNKKKAKEISNGPAKSAIAFGITNSRNGINLCDDEIFIIDSETIPTENIVQTTRIGISKSVDLPWRFYIKENRFVSRK